MGSKTSVNPTPIATNLDSFQDENGLVHVVFDPSQRNGTTKNGNRAMVCNTGPAVNLPGHPNLRIQMFVTAPK